MQSVYVESDERLKATVPPSETSPGFVAEYRRASREKVLTHRDLFGKMADRRQADRLADFEERLVGEHVYAIDGQRLDPKSVSRLRPATVEVLLALVLCVLPHDVDA